MTRTTRRRLLVAAVALLAAPVALDWLLTSDEERVEEALAGLEEGFEARDPDAVALWCTPDARLESRVPLLGGAGRLPAPLDELVRRLLPRFEKLSIERGAAELSEADSGELRVSLEGSAFAALASFGAAPFRVRTVLRFARSDDGRLRLAAVEQLEIHPLFG